MRSPPRSAAMRSRTPGRAERADRIVGGAERAPRARAERPHVGVVGVEQRLVAASTSPARLRRAQRAAVDDQRLGVGLLEVHDAHGPSPRLRLDVVRLVDRQARPRRAGAHELEENRNSSNGLTEPTIRSSSPYLRSLKWKPPRRPPTAAARRSARCSRPARGGRGRRARARARRVAWQTSSAEPQSARSVA